MSRRGFGLVRRIRRTGQPSARPRRAGWGRWAARAGMVLAGLAVGAWVGASALVGPGVPRGTTVAGVSLGGLPPTQAAEVLQRQLADRAGEPLVLVAGDRQVQVDPANAGLHLDATASVTQAGTRSINPVSLIPVALGALQGRELPAVVRVDEPALAAAARTAARELSHPPRPGGVRFELADGHPVAVPDPPQPGVQVTATAVSTTVRQGFLRRTRLSVPAQRVEPAIGSREVTRALQTVAAPAIAAPIHLDTPTGTVQVSPTTLAGVLSMRPDQDGSRLKLHVDTARLRERLDEAVTRLEHPAVDATIRFVGGEPQIVPSQAGVRIADADLAHAVRAALAAPNRTADLPRTTVQPQLSTAQARQLGVVEQVSSFTTYFPYAEYRNVNIGRAAQLIDGTLLAPGDVFSFNELVGQRTRANGFTDGFIIRNGRFELDLGGGVSQLATTTYNAAFFAGLQDVEHHPHSLYISRYPVGREATVAWPVKDLRFANDTPYGVAVHATVDPASPGGTGAVTVSMWSTRHRQVSTSTSPRYRVRTYPTVYDTSQTCSPSSGVVGFDVDVTRVIRSAGKIVAEEVDHVRYQPTASVVCGPRPSPTPQPSASATRSTQPATSTASAPATPAAPPTTAG